MTMRAALARSFALGPVLLLVACTDDAAPCRMFRGECIGVPPERLCGDAICTAGAQCARAIELEDGQGLTDAAAGAEPGTCIALREGSYGAVTLPPGVSVLGVGAADVKLGRVVIAGSSGRVMLRGLHVQGGIDVGNASVDIDSVLVEAGVDGIRAVAGADVLVRRTEVKGSTNHAIIAIDATRLAVDRSVIEDAGGPGLWAECIGGCACDVDSRVSLARSLVVRTQHVGVYLAGVEAIVDSVDVLDTLARSFTIGGGGAVMASACANVAIRGAHVANAMSFGILVQDASASIGGTSEAAAVTVSGTRYGIWLQDVGGPGTEQSVALAGVSIDGVGGVGLGFGGQSAGIDVTNTSVSATTLEQVPVVVQTPSGGVISTVAVGDGLVWLGSAAARLDGLTLDGNARASLLIDGLLGPGSSLAHVTLSGGDQNKGIIQQNVPLGAALPKTGAGVPAIQQVAERLFDVVGGPTPPGALPPP